jgi:hypothetical protein
MYAKDSRTLTYPTPPRPTSAARARCRALVVHPCNDLRPVDKVRVRFERNSGEGLVWSSGTVCMLVLVDDPKLVTIAHLPCVGGQPKLKLVMPPAEV